MKFEIYKGKVAKIWKDDNGLFAEIPVSSTYPDRHGHRIPLKSLVTIAKYYKLGTVPFVPNHDKKDWKNIMGKFVDGKIYKIKTESGETHYLLTGIVKLNESHPDTPKFVEYIKNEMPLGFSIGAYASVQRGDNNAKE